MTRTCCLPECDAPIVARPGEFPYQARKRRTCGPEHAAVARGRQMPTVRRPGSRASTPDIESVLTGAPPAWGADGACARQTPTAESDPWFAERGQLEQREVAVATCRTCPVTEQCLQFALDGKIRYGVWGATTPYQRRYLLAERDMAS